jgi:HD-GYP domain-containing protein (c-di-GMP phosphodiesterase class II)
VGKCRITQQIQVKADHLNHNEWNMIKQHPLEGFKYLNTMYSLTDEIKIIVMQHHERRSGKGYPMGLKGAQVHRYGEICSLVDSFEALTSKRPFRTTVENTFNALLILKNEMAHDIEPDIFKCFVEMFHKQS